LYGEGGIQMEQIPDIGADRDGAVRARDQDNGRIDDVGRLRAAAEDADCFREHAIERGNLRRRCREERAQHDLSRAVAPDLAENSGRYDDASTASQRLPQQRADSSIRSLERDKGARV
jgi:hypothetical protein